MARITGSITASAVALSAATAKTVLQLIAASNHRLALLSFSVSFDGASGSATPVLVELLRQTTAGTATSVTALAVVPCSETLQASGGKNCTVEPTAGDILAQWYVHPQTGFDKPFTPSLDEIQIAGGGRLGLRCTAPATVNCTATMIYEE